MIQKNFQIHCEVKRSKMSYMLSFVLKVINMCTYIYTHTKMCVNIYILKCVKCSWKNNKRLITTYSELGTRKLGDLHGRQTYFSMYLFVPFEFIFLCIDLKNTFK